MRSSHEYYSRNPWNRARRTGLKDRLSWFHHTVNRNQNGQRRRPNARWLDTPSSLATFRQISQVGATGRS